MGYDYRALHGLVLDFADGPYMSLQRQKIDWEEMAQVDPLWAIVSDPERRNGRWTVDEFFRTGEAELADVLGTSQRMGYPRAWEEALYAGYV